MTLGLLELARIEVADLTKMALAGEIRVKNSWVAMKGSAKYLKAIATGDIRPVERAKTCALACAACPSRTTRPIMFNGLEVKAGYCGTMLKEDFKSSTPTCGCLVSVTFDGQIFPGAKSMVSSERCPQGRWPE